MIIHIGENISLFKEDVICILDISSLKKSEVNKHILKLTPVNKIEDSAKSYILVKNHRNSDLELYISAISSESLLRRSNIGNEDWRKLNVKR